MAIVGDAVDLKSRRVQHSVRLPEIGPLKTRFLANFNLRTGRVTFVGVGLKGKLRYQTDRGVDEITKSTLMRPVGSSDNLMRVRIASANER